MTRRCAALKEDGSPCRAYATADSEPARCHFHGLTKKGQLEMSRNGGLGKRNKELPLSWPMIAWVLDVMVKVLNGSLSTERACSFLAPFLARGHEFELRELLDGIRVREEAELQGGDPHDRLEEARAALRQLYAEGKIGLDQLPPGVLTEADFVPVAS